MCRCDHLCECTRDIGISISVSVYMRRCVSRCTCFHECTYGCGMFICECIFMCGLLVGVYTCVSMSGVYISTFPCQGSGRGESSTELSREVCALDGVEPCGVKQ